jgi:predicted nucleic acid-binding protein
VRPRQSIENSFRTIESASRCEPEGVETLWLRDAALDTKSPLLWMDAYLASFARVLGMRFVTFDTGFRLYQGLDLLVLESASQNPAEV